MDGGWMNLFVTRDDDGNMQSDDDGSDDGSDVQENEFREFLSRKSERQSWS